MLRNMEQNLAALEFVDFVIIDENETPIKNLKRIKKNVFLEKLNSSNDSKL